MNNIKILVFANENLTLTGGNLYDTLLYNTIKKNASYSIEFCKPIIYKSGFAFKKLITPILEFKWLKKIKKSDILFWNSTDAYHCFLLVCCTRIFLPKKKIYIIHHHYKFQLMVGIKKTVFKFFEVNFLRMANTLIIPNPYVIDQTKKLLPANEIHYMESVIIPNAYFTDQTNKETYSVGAIEPNAIAEREEDFNGQMVFVGNVEYRKGIHLLIESLHLLKTENIDFQMNIIGAIIEPDYYDNLLKKIKEYNLEKDIVFHGRVTDDEKYHFMKTSAIFVFPSLLEGYAVVILEAMSYNLPVVAFNNTAMPYTIKDGYNGLLAKNEDIQDLKQKIATVLKDPSLKHKLSKGASETFSKCHKLPMLIEEMEEFARELKN